MLKVLLPVYAAEHNPVLRPPTSAELATNEFLDPAIGLPANLPSPRRVGRAGASFPALPASPNLPVLEGRAHDQRLDAVSAPR
jgi:hypothetical protein